MAKIQKKFIDPALFLDEISFFDKVLETSYQLGFFNLFNPFHLGEDIPEDLSKNFFIDIYNPTNAAPVHTHDNATVLNNTEESFTTVLKNKLEEISLDFILSHMYGYYNIYNPLYR